MFTATSPLSELSVPGIQSALKSLFVLQLQDPMVSFRGQMIALPEGDFCFLGIPWILNQAELRQAGLSKASFALHDTFPEFINAVSLQKRALSQIHDLNELLRERNERLDMFAATLAHDLRNPLSVIQSGVDFLQSGMCGADTAAVMIDILWAVCREGRTLLGAPHRYRETQFAPTDPS